MNKRHNRKLLSRSVLRYIVETKFYLVLIVFFVSLLSVFFCFSFTTNANDEKITRLFSDLCFSSETSTVNFDLINKNKSLTYKEFNDVVGYCNSANKQIQSGDNFNFKPLFGNDPECSVTIKEIGDSKAKSLLHYGSGKPHRNAKEEYIHDSYEIAMMFDSIEGNYVNVHQTTYIAIRQQTANYLIGKDEPTREDYVNLINNQSLTLAFHNNDIDKEIEVNICNIVLDGLYDDAYYSSIFGNYFLLNTYYSNCLPFYDSFSINFDFNSSNHEIKEYIHFIRRTFESSSYYCLVNKQNLNLDGGTINAKIETIEKNLYSSSGFNEYFAWALFIIACVGNVAAIVFFYYRCKNQNHSFHKPVLFIAALILYTICYYLFYFLNKINLDMSKFFISDSIISSLLVLVLFGAAVSLMPKFKKIQTINCEIQEVNI